jgi:hypothetical protein
VGLPARAFLRFVAALAGSVACGCGASSSLPDDGAGTGARADGGPAAPARTMRASDCASCHLDDFEGARGHVGQRPTTCAVCHVQESWHPAGLHHGFWPLTGKHETARCFACHTGDPPVFRGTGTACVACHRPEYERAPGHAGRFPTSCEQCHSTDAWKPPLPGHPEPPRPASPQASPPATTPRPTPTPTPTANPTPTARPRPSSVDEPVEPVTGASRRR